jgi:FMN phosphatase YigB (HAD superfamily)
MHAGRSLTSHDILFSMFPSFFRKSRQKMIDLSNIQAVLFDLDGTLVDVDMNQFVPSYLRRLTEHMSDQVNPIRATQALHQAVAAMFANTDAGKTLESILFEVLQAELAISPEWYVECLARFCRDDLESLRPLVTGHPLSSKLFVSSLA